MRRLVLISILLLLLTGCGTSSSGLAKYAPAEENRLVIYTSHKAQVYQPIIQEFEERTGIWVELVTGGTAELLDLIQKEQEEPQADVLFGGGVESVAAYQECFADYRSAGQKYLPEGYRENNPMFWTPFSALPVVLIYNTQLVEPELLTGWADLSRPEFRGKVAFADPNRSGSSFTALMTCFFVGSDDYVQMLAESLDGKQLESSSEVLTTVADGTSLVGVTLEETALRKIAEGANIGMVYPVDGTSAIPDGTTIIRKAPHEENARRFVDFTLSYDVQSRLGSTFYRRSVREDVPEDADMTPLAELHIAPYDAAWVSAHRETLLTQWSARVKEAAQ